MFIKLLAFLGIISSFILCQNNFTWKTILAMPPNLLSFCLGATYNVLPSPKNLKRWHLASESRCFLCHKDVCTIPHILGACKISLQQGRFTFRHDSVLQNLVLVLKSFLKNLPINATKKSISIPHLLRSLRKVGGLLIYLLSKLVLEDTLPSRYQFSLKD